MSFCKVVMNGRLCADPELKQTPGGVYVTSFRIALNKGQNEVRFYNVVAWRSNAEFIVKHFGKGDGICLSGDLDYRTYEQNGAKHTVYEIICDAVGFPDGKVKKDAPAEKDTEPSQFEAVRDDGDLPF